MRGPSIQLRGDSAFPKMSFPDSIKGWQGTLFYYRDDLGLNNQSGLPSYSVERVRAPESLSVTM